MQIKEFQGGSEPVRYKLNEIVNAVNMLMKIRGDEEYIKVATNTNGSLISLNINKILARIPKFIFGNCQLVDCQNPTGGNGGPTEFCSLLYDVYTLGTSDLIASAVEVRGGRPLMVFTYPGTLGLFYRENGSPKLAVVFDETWDEYNCPSGASGSSGM